MFRFLILLLKINWQNYRPADCLPRACFCETIGNGLIRQPINAYTNLGYIIVGILILIFLNKSKYQAKQISEKSGLIRKLFILFGIAYIAVGIGSFLYHASFIFLGEEMDDDSMYLIGMFMVLFEYARIKKISTKQFLILYFSFNIFFEIIIYFFPVIRGGLFALLIAISIIFEIIARERSPIAQEVHLTDKANMLFFVAYFIWILDKTHILCHPDSIIQGHSIWHILTAYAGWVMFTAMDSEFQPTLPS
jgi:hypothetical protein